MIGSVVRYRIPGATGISPRRVPWVLLGRLAGEPTDEVWTRNRKALRAIRRCLHEDWVDSYCAKSGNRYEMPFVARNIAERELHQAISYSAEEVRVHYSETRYRNDHSIGLIVDRVIDLLIEDRVLVHPTVREFGPVWTSTMMGKGEVEGRRITKAMVWKVDEELADEWLSVRLLVLD